MSKQGKGKGISLVVTAVSDALRGEPLTVMRPYCALPLRNEPLLIHPIRSFTGVKKVTVVTAELREPIDAVLKGWKGAPIEIIHPDGVKDALEEADAILPGDILIAPGKFEPGTLFTFPVDTEEVDATRALLKRHGVTKTEIERNGYRINYPWELLDLHTATNAVVKRKVSPKAKKESGVTLVGEVVIGSGTVIKAGSYIEGPVVIGADCIIGPQAHLRSDTYIGDGCEIGKTEVVDTVFLPRVTSKHHAYLGHSVVCSDVNIGAFTVTADLRHDKKDHVTLIQSEKIDTGRRKLGAFIGDFARTGISTSFYPGRKLWPELGTLPGEVVTKDKQ